MRRYIPLLLVGLCILFVILARSARLLYNADCRAEKSEREIYTGDENPDGLYDNACRYGDDNCAAV